MVHKDVVYKQLFYTAIDTLSKILAPILVHTTEEVWDYLNPNATSIHLEAFPQVKEYAVNEEEWDALFELRTKVFKSIRRSTC